jgi:hypothetical protein
MEGWDSVCQLFVFSPDHLSEARNAHLQPSTTASYFHSTSQKTLHMQYGNVVILIQISLFIAWNHSLLTCLSESMDQSVKWLAKRQTMGVWLPTGPTLSLCHHIQTDSGSVTVYSLCSGLNSFVITYFYTDVSTFRGWFQRIGIKQNDQRVGFQHSPRRRLSAQSICLSLRSAIFWESTQRRLVILYWRFGTTYRSHLQGSRSPGWQLSFIACGSLLSCLVQWDCPVSQCILCFQEFFICF